jgi:hypothetical protein
MNTFLQMPKLARTAGLAALLLGASLAHADGGRDRGRDDWRRNGSVHGVERGGERGPAGRWFDGAHGHAHVYPAPGGFVRVLPPQSRFVFWAGVRYSFFDGVWYGPGPSGYAVVRPPFGIVIGELPPFRTVLTIGGFPYYYANGVYYRERGEGGYEVVPPPVASAPTRQEADERVFVYPRMNQSPAQQASDEYECHRWAAGQAGFDPTAVATGQAGAAAGSRGDYVRARNACLDGRGYTTR